MIHIVFNEDDIRVLSEAIALDDSLQGEIMQIKDDYAVGPIQDIYTEEGIEARRNWWKEVVSGGDYENIAESNDIDDNKQVENLIQLLRENDGETVWIWAAQNKHDVSGYYWLISFLKEF